MSKHCTSFCGPTGFHNGSEFQPYSAPFVVSPLQTEAIYAFADDNAANRSGLFSFPLGIDMNFLPIISTGGGSSQ